MNLMQHIITELKTLQQQKGSNATAREIAAVIASAQHQYNEAELEEKKRCEAQIDVKVALIDKVTNRLYEQGIETAFLMLMAFHHNCFEDAIEELEGMQ